MAKRILIVDDEEHIRRVMRMTVEAAGYEAGEASDGPRGLETFGDGTAWDAVLLDQKMPGMDGLETLRRMKTRSPGVRVIMVTAYASVELAVDAMKLGAMDFVRKPMTPEILRNALTAALAKPAVPSEPQGAAQAGGPAAPPVSRVTMNGFRFWPDPEAGYWQRREPGQCRFVVEHPDGHREEIVVEFPPQVARVVESSAQRRLPPDSPFWIALAERCLNTVLWNQGAIPRGGRLVVEPATLDAESLAMAKRWEKVPPVES